MYSYISYFIKTSIFAFLCNDYLQRNYPTEYNSLLVSISYNGIYYYSKLQILCNKIKNKLNLLIETNPQLKKMLHDIYTAKNKQMKIIHFNNGVIHMKKITNDTVKLFDDLLDSDNNKNALYILADYENGNTNYLVSPRQDCFLTYEKSNIKFLLVELQLKNLHFKIDLKTETENYYIVSNTLDKVFFLYYMFNYSHNFTGQLTYQELSSQIEQACVTIIDSNVNKFVIHLSKNESITIDKDKYIVNNNNNNNNTTLNLEELET